MVATFRSHKKAEEEQAKKPQDFLHKLRRVSEIGSSEYVWCAVTVRLKHEDWARVSAKI